MNILGKWKKNSGDACSNKYPNVIEFKSGNLYEAEVSPVATTHPLWDVGTYQTVKNKIQMSTSNDAVIAYDFTLKEKTLVIKDADGCTLKFQRIQ